MLNLGQLRLYPGTPRVQQYAENCWSCEYPIHGRPNRFIRNIVFASRPSKRIYTAWVVQSASWAGTDGHAYIRSWKVIHVLICTYVREENRKSTRMIPDQSHVLKKASRFYGVYPVRFLTGVPRGDDSLSANAIQRVLCHSVPAHSLLLLLLHS